MESLKQIGQRLEETSSDGDRMFPLGLLPAMKQLSLLHKMDFRVEVQETLRRKLRRSAAPESLLITYQSMSSASPSALSDYSSNSQPNKPCSLHFCVSGLLTKCHGSRKMLLYRLGRPLNLHLHPGALPFNQMWKDHQYTRITFTSYT